MRSWARIALSLGLIGVAGILGVLVGMADSPAAYGWQEATATSEPGFEPVDANDDWEPVVQEFDGVEMVLVPAGCFMMGSTDEQVNDALQMCEAALGDCEREWFEDEQPVHEVCFEEPFWIDRYEVTQGQVVAIVEQATDTDDLPGGDHPHESVTWFEARDFCGLRGARLPTEAEWEYAARGPDSWVYAWGNEVNGTQMNFCDSQCGAATGVDWADTGVDDGYGGLAPVGSYEAGMSWVGTYDLSGNVWEWTSSQYVEYPYDAVGDGKVGDEESRRVLRGGSFQFLAAYARSAHRGGHEPDRAANDLGFRCARSR